MKKNKFLILFLIGFMIILGPSCSKDRGTSSSPNGKETDVSNQGKNDPSNKALECMKTKTDFSDFKSHDFDLALAQFSEIIGLSAAECQANIDDIKQYVAYLKEHNPELFNEVIQ